MASKTKHRFGKVSTAQLFEQAQRQLSKNDSKQALKNAKVCFRQDPCDKHRKLLESAYVARSEELLRLGLEPQAREALKDLLRLGVVEPLLKQRMVELSAALGMLSEVMASDSARAANAAPQAAKSTDMTEPTPEATLESDGLRNLSADHAVLRPSGAANSDHEIREGAQRIRAALDLLVRGDDEQALEQLQDIARRSPFADWKLFVRGMAAYYADDPPRMKANFERLDPARKAHRIARQILALAAADSDDDLTAEQRRLADYICHDSLSKRINKLKQHLSAKRWSKAVSELRGVSGSLAEIDPGMSDRLVRLVCDQLRSTDQESALTTLWRSVKPLESDPHWNRSKALYHDCNNELEEAETYWLAFLQDLRGLSSLSSEERRIAEGQIYDRLGKMRMMRAKWARDGLDEYGDEYEDEFEDDFEDDFEEDFDDLPEEEAEAIKSEARKHREEALRFLEMATQTAPELEESWVVLAHVCDRLDDSEKAAEVRRQKLEHFPTDHNSLKEAVRDLYERGQPPEARDLLRRAHQAKPDDEYVRLELRDAHVRCARRHAECKEFDLARTELDAAAQLQGVGADQLWNLCRARRWSSKPAATSRPTLSCSRHWPKWKSPAPCGWRWRSRPAALSCRRKSSATITNSGKNRRGRRPESKPRSRSAN